MNKLLPMLILSTFLITRYCYSAQLELQLYCIQNLLTKVDATLAILEKKKGVRPPIEYSIISEVSLLSTKQTLASLWKGECDNGNFKFYPSIIQCIDDSLINHGLLHIKTNDTNAKEACRIGQAYFILPETTTGAIVYWLSLQDKPRDINSMMVGIRAMIINNQNKIIELLGGSQN